MSTAAFVDALIELKRRAAACLTADERSDEYADIDAQREYADEQLTLAARELTRATNNLPLHEQPVGWREPAWSSCCGGTGYADYAAVPCPAPDCPVPSPFAIGER